MDDYVRVLFHPFLSAYRKGYSCQSTLLALTEDWRQSLDGGHLVGVSRGLSIAYPIYYCSKLQIRYSILDKEVKRKTKSEKRAFIGNLADEAETTAQMKTMATMYKIITALASWRF